MHRDTKYRLKVNIYRSLIALIVFLSKTNIESNDEILHTPK